MNELLSVALVCASVILPGDCNRNTALDVVVAPAKTPYECLMHAQVMAAGAGLPGGADRYLKIDCEHRKVAAAEPRN